MQQIVNCELEQKADAVEAAVIPFKQTGCVVNSYTEWDLLEEVIVGVVKGACFPPWHKALQPVLPDNQHEVFQRNAGKSSQPSVLPQQTMS